MTEDRDRPSRMKALVAAARKGRGGDAAGGDAPSGTTTESAGPVGRVKAALAKVTQEVTGIVKKDDPAGNGRDAGAHGPTENARKMKAAVEAARQAKED